MPVAATAAPAFLQPESGSGSIPAARAAAAPKRTLPFVMQPQLLGKWCWAATTASVRRYYETGTVPSQCQIADIFLSRRDCCPPAGPGPDIESNLRNRVYALDRALGNHLNGPAIRGILSFEDIVEQIEARRPICCHIDINEGHFNAIIGYDASVRDIEVRDPLHGNHTIPYAEFCTSFKGGRWDYTYLTR